MIHSNPEIYKLNYLAANRFDVLVSSLVSLEFRLVFIVMKNDSSQNNQELLESHGWFHMYYWWCIVMKSGLK